MRHFAKKVSLEGIEEESDIDLPANEKHIISKITDREYLKMYQMRNPMHDPDREAKKSIVANLVVPDDGAFKKNPYLNKVPDEEPEINLHALDLLNL